MMRMLLGRPSLALSSVPVLAGWLAASTVNRKFRPNSKPLGLAVFPANCSNPALNPTTLSGVGLALR